MEEQHGQTATLARERPTEAVDSAESRPLTINLPVSFSVGEQRKAVGKWVGRCVDLMLEGQTRIEIERVVVHIHLKDPEAWED